MESIWGVKFLINKKIQFYGVHMESMWSPVESMWSYGVHMESMGECKVHLLLSMGESVVLMEVIV